MPSPQPNSIAHKAWQFADPRPAIGQVKTGIDYARKGISAVARTPGLASLARAGALTHIGVSEAEALYGSTQKSNADYSKQTGVENGIGARIAGTLQDIGNAVTFGQADKVGNLIAGNGYTASPHLQNPGQQPAFMQQQGQGENLQASASSAGVQPGSIAEYVRRDRVPGHAGPLCSNNLQDPSAGMNAKPGINGRVGNASTVGFDKAAIERGMAADRDLHNARIEAMDGRAPVEGGRAAMLGDSSQPEWMQPGGAARASLSEIAANSPRAKYRAQAAQALASIDSQQAIARGNQAVSREGQQAHLSISQANNDAHLQRQLLEQGQRAPGIQLDNETKWLALAGQKQLSDLQNQYLKLNDTSDPGGTQRRSIASQLLTMQGKTAPDKYKVVEVGGGKDASGNDVPRSAYLFDRETGQYQPFGQQQQAQAAPYKDGTELMGKDGKRYVVRNGEPVLKG